MAAAYGQIKMLMRIAVAEEIPSRKPVETAVHFISRKAVFCSAFLAQISSASKKSKVNLRAQSDELRHAQDIRLTVRAERNSWGSDADAIVQYKQTPDGAIKTTFDRREVEEDK
jgi:hypothetical protein